VVHFLRPVEVDRPLECDACEATFVVRRGIMRARGPMNLRSRSMEDLSVGSTRPSGIELKSVSAGALFALIVLVLILLLTRIDWTGLAEGIRALLE
jgi:hypothetical protein